MSFSSHLLATRTMALTSENARRIAAQFLAAEGSAPSWTPGRPASAPIPLTRSSLSALGQGDRTANAADVRQLREAILKHHDRASSHVRSTGQNSTTAATDRAAAQQASPSTSPSPTSPTESSPPDLSRTTPSGGWSIAGLWRKARGINLEAMADRNPVGFITILIALASLIVGVAQFVWSVIQGVASLVIEARSSSTGEAMKQARRRVEDSWENVRRRADNFARSVGLSLPARSFDRIHARQWEQLKQEKKDP